MEIGLALGQSLGECQAAGEALALAETKRWCTAAPRAARRPLRSGISSRTPAFGTSPSSAERIPTDLGAHGLRHDPDGPWDPAFPCVPEFPCAPAVPAACLAACAAAFACRCASELVRPGLSGLTLSSASWRHIALSRPVRPTHAEKSGAVPVRSEVVGSDSGASVSVGSGASVSVGSGEGDADTVTEGLGVGLPGTPPVAALAMVPAATSTARTVRKNLSGFIRSNIGRKPLSALLDEGLVGRRLRVTTLAASS